ncbi:MAG: hypothetical protein ACOX9C_05245 [Kiritimatiellia bacterium]|jgi:hypothetical protein
MKKHTLIRFLAAVAATVAATAAVFADPVGVRVNGVMLDSYGSVGPGWSYDPKARILALGGAGPFTLSGRNTAGDVCVVVPEGVVNAVTLSNLTLRATGDGQSAFALEANACVSLFLAGRNRLASGDGRAGLEVPSGREISITHAPGAATGSLTAWGGECGAGIGGGQYGHGGTVTIYGGTVAATGGECGAGIGGGLYSRGGTVTISDGTVTATGGLGGAGIGGGYGDDGGTVEITGGTVTAVGGENGAGIGGGGYYGAGGTVNISGGRVTATGGEYNAAGIGGGDDGAGGTVTISGGWVAATGGSYGTGIGGGGIWDGAGGTVAISGGTVFAQGNNSWRDMGPALRYAGNEYGTNIFTGGSIRLASSSAAPTPSNGTVRVGYATVSGFEPCEMVEFTNRGNLPNDYGTTDIYADDDGSIYLWLPDDNYHFTANGRHCTTRIKDGAGPTGVTVNGEEAAYGPANPDTAGWSFDAANRTVTLSGAGPFTLSGANVIGGVGIAVASGVTNTVALSNLTLKATGANQCAFALGTGANVSLVLAGVNTLASGEDRAGIEVAEGQTLAITHAPGDATGSLTATGGECGAGIGGGDTHGGTVTIHGGTITAFGSWGGAGIGGGRTGNGGTIEITGGSVFAQGGENGAGIGGATSYGDGGTVTISGGTVFAQGGENSAGIGGGGRGGNGGMVTISGGTVSATGGEFGAGIGGGGNAYYGGGCAGGTVEITGGTVVATGSDYAAGIGGGYKGAGGTVTINGGTVAAAGGCDAEDIGHGNGATVSGANIFTGGSIRLANMIISASPSNDNMDPLACAVVSGFAPDAPVVFASPASGLPDYYGTNDIAADAYGCIYLWLTDGTFVFTANERACSARVEKGPVGSSGVTINGDDVAFEPADPYAVGWTRASGSPVISGLGPFTISGANVLGQVSIGITDNYFRPSVTLSNLTIRSTSEAPVFVVSSPDVSILLAGTNTLASDASRAGLELRMFSSVSIDSADGGRGVLHATGGSDSPGIGIGIGNVDKAGATAPGGAGSRAAPYEITIDGGEIHATGGINGAGIGGDGGALFVTVSGGTLFAAGDAANGVPDIGFREDSSFFCENTFAGGSIRLANNWISAAPVNNGAERVWCMTFPGFAPGATPEIAGLPEGYGTDDLVADEDGRLYLWLPSDDYLFTVDGVYHVATVAGADAAATDRHFFIDSFSLADDTATFTLDSRLPADLFHGWLDTATFKVEYCTDLADGVWTTLPGAVQRSGTTLSVGFTPPDSPRLFLRVLSR